jgi:hypothetical protein
MRRLLRENPMPGQISLSFEREPDYFIGAGIEGPFHQTIIGRDQQRGEIVGMASRAVRQVYLNGRPQSVGYLSQFRLKPDYRAMRRLLGGAFEFLRTLDQDGRTPFYLASIIADNNPARRLLTAGLPGWPCFQPYHPWHTLAITCRRQRNPLALPAGLRLIRGQAELQEGILDCLARNGSQQQFAPVWSRELLFNSRHTPDLKPEDFFLVIEGERVRGCLALWDQNRFKQTVVRGYSGLFKRWRWAINLGARLWGWPHLPAPHSPFHFAFASHLAIDHDRVDLFGPLLRAVYNEAASRGYSYFMFGLNESHPAFSLVRTTYRYIDYRSQLYLVNWPDSPVPRPQLEARPPGVEIAVM